MTPSAAEIKAEEVQYNSYSYEQPYSNTWDYSSNYNFAAPDSVAYYNTTSCVDAANIIRTMRAGTGPELDANVGCHAPSQHCFVDNNAVYTMMDKYANQHAGI